MQATPPLHSNRLSRVYRHATREVSAHTQALEQGAGIGCERIILFGVIFGIRRLNGNFASARSPRHARICLVSQKLCYRSVDTFSRTTFQDRQCSRTNGLSLRSASSVAGSIRVSIISRNGCLTISSDGLIRHNHFPTASIPLA